jgi:hypothetical protein
VTANDGADLDGIDHISLASYTGIDDFADLKGKIQQVGNDCIIILLHGVSITIDDTLKSAIKANDFQFQYPHLMF